MAQLKYWNGSAWVNLTVGAAGVAGATAPLNYNSGTQLLSLNIGNGLTTSSSNLVINSSIVPLLASSNTFTSNQLISASSTGNALEIRQTGSGNALVVEDDTNPDATPFVINASGQVGIGTSSPSAPLSIANTSFGVDILRYSATSSSHPALELKKSKSGTVGTNTAIVSGDAIGRVTFAGADGTNFISGAQVSAEADGTVSTNIVPGRLIFTTANTSGTMTERMRIDSAGNVGIGTSSPKTKLHTTGTSSASMPALGTASGSLYVTNADTSYGLLAGVSSSTGAVWLQAQRTDATATAYDILLNPSGGNVGIGTTAPAAKLDVNGGIHNNSGVLFYKQTNNAANNGIVLGTVDKASASTGGSGSLTIQSNDATNRLEGIITLVTNATAGSRRLQIQAVEQNVAFRDITLNENGGNVGIGVTPAAKLDVLGGSIQVRAAATQDGILLTGRAGGTSSWDVIFTPTTLTADRTITLPDASGTLALTSNLSSYAQLAGATFTGQIISTDTYDANTGGGQIYLNAATGNRIDFNSNGVAAPAFTTRSAGTKIVLYPEVGASSVDYGIGIESSTLWFSVPQQSNRQFKWYAGTTNIATLTGAGAFSAVTKSFDIEHPTKENMRLRYGSLEGPENGVYVRGKSKEDIIELPDYWTGLVDADSITVSITPIGKKQDIYVDKIEDNKVYLGGKIKEYFFTIFAERKDVDKLIVEY